MLFKYSHEIKTSAKQIQLALKREVYFKAHSLIHFVGTNYVNNHSINQDETI